VRAYRPSRCIDTYQKSEDPEVFRLTNVETYARRVSLGKPLFEEDRHREPTDRQQVKGRG
jgi:hypothetical protein